VLREHSWELALKNTLAHFPQFLIQIGQNFVSCCQKPLRNQPLFFESRM
jgi:hypothetical protein